MTCWPSAYPRCLRPGFALYLDELERLSAPLPPVQQQGTERQWLNIALPKGRLGDQSLWPAGRRRV